MSSPGSGQFLDRRARVNHLEIGKCVTTGGVGNDKPLLFFIGKTVGWRTRTLRGDRKGRFLKVSKGKIGAALNQCKDDLSRPQQGEKQRAVELAAKKSIEFPKPILGKKGIFGRWSKGKSNRE